MEIIILKLSQNEQDLEVENEDSFLDENPLEAENKEVKQWDPVNFAVTCRYVLFIISGSETQSKTKPNSRIWLDESKPKDKKMLNELEPTLEKIGGLSTRYCHGFNTTRNETVNSVTSNFIPKQTEFWRHYGDKVNLTTLTINAESPQKVYSALLGKMGLPVSNQIVERLESEDRTTSKQRIREKSKNHRARTSQLQRLRAIDSAEEKKESARIANKLGLESIEYETQGAITNAEVDASPAPCCCTKSSTLLHSIGRNTKYTILISCGYCNLKYSVVSCTNESSIIGSFLFFSENFHNEFDHDFR